MARPVKNTVDYFPHVCKHNKTMFIIESHFGNDGYAFWFKLLECLGASENHYINCNVGEVWEYLQAKAKLDEEICIKILDKLAKLDAIDAELWQSKIIYSDNFVKNIADAYEKRKTNMMTKTELMMELTEFLPEKTTPKHNKKGVKGVDNTQSIVEKTKVEKNKKEVYAPAVTFTKEEYEKLKDRFGEKLAEKIESLSLYKESKGVKYSSDYATILAWDRREAKATKDAKGEDNKPSRPGMKRDEDWMT